jgi:hypothetical protein
VHWLKQARELGGPFNQGLVVLAQNLHFAPLKTSLDAGTVTIYRNP